MPTLIFLGCAGWCLLSVGTTWRTTGVDALAWLGMAASLTHTAATAF